MRILFFTHYFPPEVNAPASRTYELAKRWVRSGHQVTILTGAPNAPDGVLYPGYHNRLVQREVMDGIEVVRVWTFLAANKGIALRMMNYLSYMISATACSIRLPKHDVIIATTPQLFCGWAGFFSARWSRTPFILEIRDMWADSIATLQLVKRSLFVRLLAAIEDTLYGQAQTIVTVGTGYRSMLIDKHLPPERIEVITNGVDREFFAPRAYDEQLAQQWSLTGRFVCAYTGTIGMTHALEVVLRAAAKLQEKHRDDMVFLIVGEGAHRQALQQQAAQQGLNNVIFVGKQPKSMMPRIHSISDCNLVHLRRAPLYTTVFPSKIFEVAHMKVPIILGVEGEAAKLIERSHSGVCIEPENDTQLLNAVEMLAADPDKRRELGEAGHDFVAEHFDRDQLADKYLQVLERTLAKGHKRPRSGDR